MRNSGGGVRWGAGTSWFQAVLRLVELPGPLMFCSVDPSGRLVDIMGRLLAAPGGLETPCFHAVFLSGLKVGCASKGAGNVVFGRTPMFDIGMRTTMLLHMGVYVRLWRHHIA